MHAVGPDATYLNPGDLVYSDFWNRSRDNPDDSILQGYMCGIDSFEAAWSNGTYAEYARVPLERVWKLNEDLLITRLGYSFADLCYLGPVCVPLAGLLDVHVQAGDTVIIAPATGTFGGSAVQAALALGATVIACGRNANMLAKMSKAFASTGRFAIVQMSGDAGKDTAAIKEKCINTKGADVYVDFSPPQAAGSKHRAACLAALRPYGNALLMGLVYGDIGLPYSTVMIKNLRIQGRYMFEKWHGEQAIKLVEVGAMKLGSGEGSGIVTTTFKMPEIEQALELAEKQGSWGNMVVLEP